MVNTSILSDSEFNDLRDTFSRDAKSDFKRIAKSGNDKTLTRSSAAMKCILHLEEQIDALQDELNELKSGIGCRNDRE